MPAAIPVIASFAAAGSAAAAAGGFAAAMGTLSGFAAISGAVLTGVGALTGKKDLQKVGTLLSLGGSAASAFGASQGAAASAFGGADAVGQAITAAGGPTMSAGSSAFLGGEVAATPFAGMSGASIYEPLSTASTAAGELAGAVGKDMAFNAGSGMMNQFVPAKLDPLQAAASNLSMSDMNAARESLERKASLWDRAGSAVGKTADFMRKNKELVQIGGQGLNSAFGPEAELADLKRDEWDYRRSLLDRQRRNLNAPIRLAMGG